MTEWIVEYIPEAENDLKKLDKSQQLLVLKAIQKVSQNPLPKTEGGYGKALGNHLTSKLAGYMKTKLVKAGIRIVYKLLYSDKKVNIIIISIRDDETVYKMATKRI